MAKDILVRGGTSHLHPFLSAGILPDLYLCRSTNGVPSKHVLAMLCLDDTVFLDISTTSGFYNLSTFSTHINETLGKNFDKAVPFGTECSKASHPLLCVRLRCLCELSLTARRVFSGEAWTMH